MKSNSNPNWDPSHDTFQENDYLTSLAQSMTNFRSKNRFGRLSSSGSKTTHSRPHESFQYRKILKQHIPWREKPLDQMKPLDWQLLCDEFKINFKGLEPPRPIRFWKESNLDKHFLKICKSLNFVEPTPIQRASIPGVLANRDVLGLAETGGGKTLAFLLPLLDILKHLPPVNRSTSHMGPYAIIIAPTRELVQQIAKAAKPFISTLSHSLYLTYGGGPSIHQQQFDLQDGVDLLIATPGRLADLLKKRYLALNQCFYLVLDEADRMIDLNYEADLDFIIQEFPTSSASSKLDFGKLKGRDNPSNDQQPSVSNLPDLNSNEPQHDSRPTLFNLNPSMALSIAKRTNKKVEDLCRQTIMFSATMPPFIEKIVKNFMHNALIVSIGKIGKATLNVTQNLEWVLPDQKNERLQKLVSRIDFPAIIFVNRILDTQIIFDLLKRNYSCAILHGKMNQEQRDSVLDQFRRDSFDILLSTDLIGRGIDIKGVQSVVNYSLPVKYQQYVHRIGRTGRAGSKGTAYSFVSSFDTRIIPELVENLKKLNVIIPRPILDFAKTASSSQNVGSMRRKRDRE